jgi:hypothetical protein
MLNKGSHECVTIKNLFNGGRKSYFNISENSPIHILSNKITKLHFWVNMIESNKIRHFFKDSYNIDQFHVWFALNSLKKPEGHSLKNALCQFFIAMLLKFVVCSRSANSSKFKDL